SRIYLGGRSMRWDGTDRKTHIAFASDPNAGAGTPEISPDGERAIVQATDQIYVVTVPPPGSQPPPISLRGPNVPVHRATVIGGEFAGWANDGKSFFYSLGNSFFTYDLAAGDAAVRDSIERGRDGTPAKPDTTVQSASGKPAYEATR